VFFKAKKWDKIRHKLLEEFNKPLPPRHKYLTGGERLEKVKNFLIAQKFKCAICEEGIGMNSHLDHCHKTGIYRGVLCYRCNTGLGVFKDNPHSLAKAFFYLLDAKLGVEWRQTSQ
jgi:hypothetical protein